MLKPVEQEWWQQVGRPFCLGGLSVAVPAFVVWGLLIGLTTN